MNLVQELRGQARAYVGGRNSVAALREWLEDRIQIIADAKDPELRGLESERCTLISDHDLAHRDEVGLRSLLAEVSSPFARLSSPSGPYGEVGRHDNGDIAAGPPAWGGAGRVRAT
jgi:hypothetical protein